MKDSNPVVKKIEKLCFFLFFHKLFIKHNIHNGSIFYTWWY